MNGITYRYNTMTIQSIDTFLNIKGGYHNNLRDVYFIRSIGEIRNIKTEIINIDKKMDAMMASGRLVYKRVSKLPVLSDSKDVEYYTKSYDSWKKTGKVAAKDNKSNAVLTQTLTNATIAVIDKYKLVKPNASDTIVKNFITKIWFWTDNVLSDAIKKWSEMQCVKVIADNVDKDQDFLFYYFVTMLGYDVFIANFKADSISDNIKSLSKEVKAGKFADIVLPPYVHTEPEVARPTTSAAKPVSPQVSTSNSGKRPSINITEAGRQHHSSSSSALSSRTIVNSNIQNSVPAAGTAHREKSFEELAQLASSIVMIAVLDIAGASISSGSGIMIGKDGFILTNNHVVEDGNIFAVKIEDDEEVYTTTEVIKHNADLDLAVIRIEKRLNPIPIYKGPAKLVRGQRVIAIGSPLGLFNSVSDGIISGFRNIDNKDMIQFTAPISHGSSGGAVLNMNGELIGISTAGIDAGQNINLAVGYENIRTFARGFY